MIQRLFDKRVSNSGRRRRGEVGRKERFSGHMCNVFPSISVRNLPDAPATKVLYTSLASIFFSLFALHLSRPQRVTHFSARVPLPNVPLRPPSSADTPLPHMHVPLPPTHTHTYSHIHKLLLLLCTRLFRRTDPRVIENDSVRIFVSIVLIWIQITTGGLGKEGNGNGENVI